MVKKKMQMEQRFRNCRAVSALYHKTAGDCSIADVKNVLRTGDLWKTCDYGHNLALDESVRETDPWSGPAGNASAL